jgi:hypothetical protein
MALLAAGALAPLASAQEGPAGAAPAPEPPPPTPTFRYQEPAGRDRWRAAAGEGLILGLGLGMYAIWGSPTAAPGSKGDGLLLDATPFRTNFVAHPLAGAAYHQMARGHRLGAWESAAWSFGASAAWEAIEYREPASLNDLLVTPLGGVALGETLFQLAAHFDRAPRSFGGDVGAWVLGLPKKLSDLLDGAVPARGDPGDSLSSDLWASGGTALAGGAWRGEARLGLGWRLVRDPAWGAPGEGIRSLRDGAVTSLAVSMALREGSLADVEFRSLALVESLYGRRLAAAAGRTEGSDWLAGLGVDFRVRLHDWALGTPNDLLGAVAFPALSGEWRTTSGSCTLALRLDLEPVFAGVRSLALDLAPGSVPPESLPTVLNAWGYYFALGVFASPSVEIRFGPAWASASGRGDWLWGLLQPDAEPGRTPSVDLRDSWIEGQLEAGARMAGSLRAAAHAGRRLRRGRADATERTAAETALGVRLTWGP